ncbi:transglutaminase family protein [Erythrobacter sp. SCSIO 43205]|uniref:transglutaminase-like domain-containing protein n=1 Tax=Erythrobacter sp. SCSIO 43205 TaxID=2779361 RepID=UPI001CA8B773|nr:transglutaminase family protein [Erythrobacter sp. SCSIO 43205]UAB77938.1 transglutaminase family protein [Erythrobacter sp. SCSIO 43205]
MSINISSHFVFELDEPTDCLMQFEAASLPEQEISSVRTLLDPSDTAVRVPAQDGIGERIWMRAKGRVEVSYEAEATIARIAPDMSSLDQLPTHMLPGEAVQYLLDSRYCRADQFQHFVASRFGSSTGGKRVAAIRDWVAHNFSYVPGSSNVQTDAAESFITRQGICRDYAHMVVALARASTIPARYVAGYAPGVSPQDFHALAEVFLADPNNAGGGTWQLVDATGMASAMDTVKIGVGRDAADVSFLTTFGPNRFLESRVSVHGN